MRLLDLLHLGHAPKAAVIVEAPPAIPAHERRQLAEAKVRIPAKWKTFDDMVRDYAGQQQTFRRQRR